MRFHRGTTATFLSLQNYVFRRPLRYLSKHNKFPLFLSVISFHIFLQRCSSLTILSSCGYLFSFRLCVYTRCTRYLSFFCPYSLSSSSFYLSALISFLFFFFCSFYIWSRRFADSRSKIVLGQGKLKYIIIIHVWNNDWLIRSINSKPRWSSWKTRSVILGIYVKKNQWHDLS